VSVSGQLSEVHLLENLARWRGRRYATESATQRARTLQFWRVSRDIESRSEREGMTPQTRSEFPAASETEIDLKVDLLNSQVFEGGAARVTCNHDRVVGSARLDL